MSSGLGGRWWWWFPMMLLLQVSPSLSWFSWGPSTGEKKYEDDNWLSSEDVIAEFSIAPFMDERNKGKLQGAREKSNDPDESCFRNVYKKLLRGCKRVMSDEEAMNRFAFELTACFVAHARTDPLPKCPLDVSVSSCAQKLEETYVAYYLEFLLETNSICHQLQIEAFMHQTEKLVNDLKHASEDARTKIYQILENGDQLLRSSNKIISSLNLIERNSFQVANLTSIVADRVSLVQDHARKIHDAYEQVSSSQKKLMQGHVEMEETVRTGISKLHKSYTDLSHGIDAVQRDTLKIQDKIKHVGDTVLLKMNDVESSADGITRMARESLENQNLLISKQADTINNLQHLRQFQEQAMIESRKTWDKFADLGRQHYEELSLQQEHLRESHHSLIQSSNDIMNSQQEIYENQKTMVGMVDNIVTVINFIRDQAWAVKSAFLYILAGIVIYSLTTSLERTKRLRPRLYFCLFVAWFLESALVSGMSAYTDNYQGLVDGLRGICTLIALGYIGVSIFCCRDITEENYEMLKLMDESLKELKEFLLVRMTYNERSSSMGNLAKWVDDTVSEECSRTHPDYCPEEDEVSSARPYNRRSRRFG